MKNNAQATQDECMTDDEILGQLTELPISPPIKGVDGKYIESLLVPKGTAVHISIVQSNRSVELWGPDACKWRPERWLNPLPQSLVDARVPGVYSHL